MASASTVGSHSPPRADFNIGSLANHSLKHLIEYSTSLVKNGGALADREAVAELLVQKANNSEQPRWAAVIDGVARLLTGNTRQAELLNRLNIPNRLPQAEKLRASRIRRPFRAADVLEPNPNRPEPQIDPNRSPLEAALAAPQPRAKKRRLGELRFE